MPFETAVVNTYPTVGPVALLTAVSNVGRCRSIFKEKTITFCISLDEDTLYMKIIVLSTTF
jgi:hypothetical protein